ncbi:hypothetical protein [Cellulomonas marina]|uniref:Uncharacterized protein n=1 Tax=Cellulomonas marina TaxID=988821 RepID=A0A1I0X6U4_9CELL|nr:hypothetical protein [Cellulomonas marina]GIG29469.1 hypothetical protein Cma02nite_20690 [Cellulomonas marina]SFA96574.1 hypothetical protein SAMN05421867_104164 [Cellulomonas marina]
MPEETSATTSSTTAATTASTTVGRPVTTTTARIEQLLVSPVHRYEGRPSDGPAPGTSDELVDG